MRIAAVIFLLAAAVVAKPMETPKPDQASWVVLAEYLDYATQGQVDYFNGPVARYRVLRTLRGPSPGEMVRIRYQFHDGSACIAEEGWKFSPALMPEPGTKWLLLLQGEGPVYQTYRGDAGRLRATPENLARFKV